MKLSNNDVITMIAQLRPDVAMDKSDVDVAFKIIGVDSLDIMSVLHTIQQQTGVEVPDDDIGELDTVAKITDYINAHI